MTDLRPALFVFDATTIHFALSYGCVPPAGDIVPRPPSRLHDYPVDVRWEVTRRYPYYLALWERASDYRQGRADTSEQGLFAHAASLVLGGIGVTGVPIDPAIPAAEVTGADPAFLTGSVQPITMRAVVATLLTGLPAADRAVVGALLVTSGSKEYHTDDGLAGRAPRVLAELEQLAQIPSAALDSCPAAPLFYVHLGASGRAITRDMEDQARRWQKLRGVVTSKVQTAKSSEYLAVWDLREGWTGSGYDRAREVTFVALGKRLKRKISTVVSQYRCAFEMIIGHPFNPDLWSRVFGPHRFAPLFGDPGTVYSAATRRRLTSPVRRPVPESVLSPGSAESRRCGVVEGKGAVEDDIATVDDRIDLEELFARGLSDTEIAARLECKNVALVTAYRARMDDLRQIAR
jgi:hypothetical protein